MYFCNMDIQAIRNRKIIAIDFDGTLVDDKYPAIGKPLPFAFETLKQLQKDGHRLILWTYRSGPTLEAAIEFCKQQGVEFYAINQSTPDEIFDHSMSRKIRADLFIDDRNVGGFPGWGKIYQLLNPHTHMPAITTPTKKKSIWPFSK